MTWSVMTWNILLGGEERFPRICSLLGRVRPDVVVLQECLGWDGSPHLARVADALEVEHTFLARARPRPKTSVLK